MESLAKQIELHTSRLSKMYNHVLNSALLHVVKALPTLLMDRNNVTVWKFDANGNTRQPFEVEYKGIKVASFCIAITDVLDQNNRSTIHNISAEDIEILYTDKQIKEF